MNVTARMIFVLTSVGLISGALLATVGMLTQERIDLNKQREIEAAILQVVPGTQSSQTVFEQDGITVYAGSDGQGNLLGYAVLASGTGFQDIITLMFGTNPDLSVISKLTILDQKETPGLGANITSRDMFLKYWDNKDSVNPLTLHKLCPRFVSITMWTSRPASNPGPRPITRGASSMVVPRFFFAMVASIIISGLILSNVFPFILYIL
ncbi:MAG: FMN-binding protein [Acidobacteria bacterium]|nr:FMN-binding protein [Acidobacteriota bacterium]